jgi:hypothetical protein
MRRWHDADAAAAADDDDDDRTSDAMDQDGGNANASHSPPRTRRRLNSDAAASASAAAAAAGHAFPPATDMWRHAPMQGQASPLDSLSPALMASIPAMTLESVAGASRQAAALAAAAAITPRRLVRQVSAMFAPASLQASHQEQSQPGDRMDQDESPRDAAQPSRRRVRRALSENNATDARRHFPEQFPEDFPAARLDAFTQAELGRRGALWRHSRQACLPVVRSMLAATEALMACAVCHFSAAEWPFLVVCSPEMLVFADRLFGQATEDTSYGSDCLPPPEPVSVLVVIPAPAAAPPAYETVGA